MNAARTAEDSARILYLTKHDVGAAGTRYRALQYFPLLRARGIHVEYSPLFDEQYLIHRYRRGRGTFRDISRALLRRLGALRHIREYDLVVLEDEVLPYCPAAIERFFHSAGVPYVVDIDDALFHQYDEHPRQWVRTILRGKIGSVMRRASLVVAGNEYLASYARRAGAPRVEVLPTALDINRYRMVETRTNPVFTIGWIGSPSTSVYLEDIAPALAEVCRGGRGRLLLVGSGRIDLPDVPLEMRPWSSETELEFLGQMDVGIMPIADSDWERGKCGFKLIQYMGRGLPVVASPVGVNVQLVSHGQNGFLAKDREGWVEALTTLRGSPELRRRMGSAGRDLAERDYGTDVTAPRLAEMLLSVARRSRPAS